MALPPHIPLAIKILPHLIQCAHEKRLTNYEEIAASINAETRLFSKPLMFIRDYICKTHNLPPLTAIVVRSGPATSSSSFDPVQFAANGQESFKEMELKAIQAVFDYPNWERALKGVEDFYGSVKA